MSVILNETVSADSYSVRIRPSKKRTIAGTLQSNKGGTGTLVASWQLQASDAINPEALAKDEIGWVNDPNSSFNSTITSSTATTEIFNFSNANNRWYRIMVDVTSGAGPVRIEANNEDMPT